MPAGHLAYHFRRRLIVDVFVGDTLSCRLRGALHNDALYALVDRNAGIVLVHFLAPHAGQLGLRGQRTRGSSRAALLGHGLGTGGLSFGNQALNSYLLVRGCRGSCLLMNGKLLFLLRFFVEGVLQKLAHCEPPRLAVSCSATPSSTPCVIARWPV